MKKSLKFKKIRLKCGFFVFCLPRKKVLEKKCVEVAST